MLSFTLQFYKNIIYHPPSLITLFLKRVSYKTLVIKIFRGWGGGITAVWTTTRSDAVRTEGFLLFYIVAFMNPPEFLTSSRQMLVLGGGGDGGGGGGGLFYQLVVGLTCWGPSFAINNTLVQTITHTHAQASRVKASTSPLLLFPPLLSLLRSGSAKQTQISVKQPAPDVTLAAGQEKYF